jgi:hypothetical protein
MYRRDFLFVASALPLAAQNRPPLFFREDWKETAAATPATQEHVANPDLILSIHGPGRAGVKKSHHDKPADDPYYIWSGTAEGNWAVSLRHKSSFVDLTGLAKIRWRSKQAGYRHMRIILKVATGQWLIGDAADGESVDWHEIEFPIAGIRWRKLDIKRIVEGAWVDKPDLSRVDEVGFTDLMTGGDSIACSRLDWLEVYGRARSRASS